MGSYGTPLPTQVSQNGPDDPNNINPYGVYGYQGYGGFSPYAGGVDNSTQNFGASLGSGGQDVDPNASMEDIFAANRNQISTTGNQIGQEAGNELNYYGPLQQQYTGAENSALNNLAQQPGFSPDEQGQINVDYSQFNTSPDQIAQEQGDPNAPVATANQGTANEGAMLNQYQSNLGGQLDQFGQNLSGAVSDYGTGSTAALGAAGTGVGGAVSGLQSGLTDAQGKFAPLDTAVNNTALGFDPNSTEKQMTDQDVQNIVTGAGTTVGNQFRTAEDTLERQAAAQGNSSPAAMAALRQQLVTQEASSAGDAMTQAQIAAQQAQ